MKIIFSQACWKQFTQPALLSDMLSCSSRLFLFVLIGTALLLIGRKLANSPSLCFSQVPAFYRHLIEKRDGKLIDQVLW